LNKSVGKTCQSHPQVKISIKDTSFMGKISWNSLNKYWTDYMQLLELEFSCGIDDENDLGCVCGG
jgi:hypothetical protein